MLERQEPSPRTWAEWESHQQEYSESAARWIAVTHNHGEENLQRQQTAQNILLFFVEIAEKNNPLLTFYTTTLNGGYQVILKC